MTLLGLVLLVLGLVLGMTVLFWIGLVLLIVGVALFFIKPGGRYYY
jgi:hypothetical protein